MTAETLPLKIERGANLDEQWIWGSDASTPYDLTGYTGALTVHVINQPGSVVLSPTIVLGGALGTIDIDSTAAQTGAVAAGDYFYVLELTSSGGIVYRVAEGIAKVIER